MNLELIKKLCEKREGGLKRLASDIGMSEQNLHRCIRSNKIQASDLENAARLLMVNINVFFDDDVKSASPHNVVKTKGDNSPASMYGDATSSNNSVLEERIKSLTQQLKDKNAILLEKERTIKILLERKQ